MMIENHLKGPSRRTAEDDENFCVSLVRLIETLSRKDKV